MQRCDVCVRSCRCSFAFWWRCESGESFICIRCVLGTGGGLNTRFSSEKPAVHAVVPIATAAAADSVCMCVWRQKVGAQISRAGVGRWEICLTLLHQGWEETQGLCDMAGLIFHIYRHVCTLNNLCTDNMMVSSLEQKMAWRPDHFEGVSQHLVASYLLSWQLRWLQFTKCSMDHFNFMDWCILRICNFFFSLSLGLCLQTKLWPCVRSFELHASLISTCFRRWSLCKSTLERPSPSEQRMDPCNAFKVCCASCLMQQVPAVSGASFWKCSEFAYMLCIGGWCKMWDGAAVPCTSVLCGVLLANRNHDWCVLLDLELV